MKSDVTQAVETAVRELASAALRTEADSIDLSTELGQLGFDSVTLVDFVDRLNARWGLDLIAPMIFEHPTLAALAEYLVEEHAASVGLAPVAAETESPRRDAAVRDDVNREHGAVESARLAGMPGASTHSSEPIAIVGVSGCFPGATDVDALWDVLNEGRDCISEIPADRWNWRDYYGDPVKEPGKTNVKWGGFIDRLASFDARFFGISPNEARFMDPQQRLLMTHAWKAIEDAGYAPASLSGTPTALYVGMGDSGYGDRVSRARLPLDIYMGTGRVLSMGPNRMSYLLNLRGPSEPVETACSSSLVAIHRGVNAIRDGQCEIALVGGVNAVLLPEAYVGFDRAGMLAKDGRCKSFSAAADGFARGEGVGMLMLKRLSAAERDGDHIYAVIRGSAVNHGGRASSVTAPNPAAQADVIARAFEGTGVDPRSIGYVEAHGSGTVLGDPIEMNGLIAAFDRLYESAGLGRPQSAHCGVGTVKTNLGHLEFAAGIAGVIKVLLQLKHGTLAQSLHSEPINPYIRLTGTPFRVVSEKAEWLPTLDAAGKAVPRRAGVSSFGLGGVNAHVVIEEYVPRERAQVPAPSERAVAIVLSAKGSDRLREQVAQLRDWAASAEAEITDLRSVAYTLQVGRDAMAFRAGMVVRSLSELKMKLADFLERGAKAEGVFCSDSREDAATITTLSNDDDAARAVDAWLDKEKYSKLLGLWVKGLNVDWQRLYANEQPSRVRLPTYPFADDRHWIDLAPPEAAATGAGEGLALDLAEQRFTAELSGSDVELGAGVCLEIARVAAERAGVDRIGQPSNPGVLIRNVEFADVAATDVPEVVHVLIDASGENELSFEICAEANEGEALVCGTVECGQPRPAERIDLAALEAGNGARAAEYAVAKLQLPRELAGSASRYMMHPALFDEVTRTASLLGGVKSSAWGVASVDSLQSFAVWPAEAVAVVRRAGSAEAGAVVRRAGSTEARFDVDVCATDGTVCARLSGLALRGAAAASQPRVEEADELMLFDEEWVPATEQGSADVASVARVVCFAARREWHDAIAQEIRLAHSGAEVVFVTEGDEYRQHGPAHYEIRSRDVGECERVLKQVSAEHGVITALVHASPLEPQPIGDASTVAPVLQALIKSQIRCGRVMLVAECSNAFERSQAESWIGFERSLGMVLPQTPVTVVLEEVDSAVVPVDGAAPGAARMQRWARRIAAELGHSKCESALYIRGQRHVSRVRPVDAEERVTSALRPGGTYLITGGCGGLGLIVARYLARTYAANLVLTGRAPLDARKAAALEDLKQLGATAAIYAAADVCDRDAMQAVVAEARARFGAINGAIHAAGVASVVGLGDKTLEQFSDVLGPKILGTVVLHEVLQGEAVDFVCYFSSASGMIGDFGSCDYSVGNRFQAAYARTRGDAVAISWPVWKDGGMGVTDEQDPRTRMYFKSSGQRLLQIEEGLRLFEQLLANRRAHTLVMAGQRDRISRFLKLNGGPGRHTQDAYSESEGIRSPPARRPELRGLSLDQCVAADLKDLAAQLLRLAREQINLEENLADFGFDSIALGEFARRLGDHYGLQIAPAIFFSHPTLSGLVSHFCTERQQEMEAFYRDAVSSVAASPASSAPQARSVARSARPGLRRRAATRRAPANESEPIAIIGISGRFPQARTVSELWGILAESRDVVEEIPADRFDWREFYGGPQRQPGKSICKWSGSVPGAMEFDPLFFEISPREAEAMDPRQRLLMQESWKALEDAGYGPLQLQRRRVGMFVGVEQGDYQALAAGQEGATSNHDGVLASRLAYFLNLNGPTMAINTACSSGLVAAHQACQSLRAGECDAAIAAGVNMLLTPQGYIGMSQAGMLSEDGKCKAFSKNANGMVPGEAVAVVILKRLSQAQADGDPIHAVIRGSGINYDGKTNGITAPSGAAQAQLLKDVYSRYAVKAREIEYVVTHGTGTPLGDPVEVGALCDAFREQTGERGFCALTSTKSNFGHTLAASGLVSLISLTQSMRHGLIPASLHCEQESEYVDWSSSPFYVNKSAKAWPGLATGKRVGAVSSFGMSGTNAHMVLESYEQPSATEQTDGPHLLVFSAKTEQALLQRIRDLAELLQGDAALGSSLHEVGHTLLCGRHHFAHRCAVVVQDREHAIRTLQQFPQKESAPNVFSGKVAREFRGQTAITRYGESLLAETAAIATDRQRLQDNLQALADLYCQGYELPWPKLFGDKPPRRISLPTYPFARERYWIPQELLSASQPGVAGSGAVLHPLAQRNTSDFEEQRFSSQFSGEEFYLRDHRVGGERVLPGVAYLEMARAALEHSGGAYIKSEGLRLRHVVWSRPFTVKDTAQLHIGLYPQDSGQIEYEVYSQESEEAERTVHSQGSAQWGEVGESHLEIDALKAACRQRLSGEQCYEQFRKIGLQYGPALQGIRELQIGEDGQGRRYVLAQLQLPPELQATQAQYVLHPTLLDSALQAAMGLSLGGETSQPMLPYAVDELRIAGRDPPRDGTSQGALYAYVREAQHSNAKLTRLDVELCDEQGRVFVQLHGFTARVLAASSLEAGGTLLLQTQWQEHQISGNGIWPSGDAHRVVYVAEGAPELDERYQQVCRQLGAERVIHVRADGELSQAYTHAAQELFGLLQAMLKDRASQRVLVQVVVPAGREVFCGLIGMLKTAQLENPKVLGQVLRVEATQDGDSLLKKLRENAEAPTALIRYEGERRYVESLQEVQAVEVTQTLFEPEGVYLITGGAGGLGRVFAQEIARSAPGAQIILAGRSANDALCEQLQQQGVSVHVRRTDVGDAASVRELIAGIEQQWGRLDGVLHAAGVVRDSFLLKKTPQELREVFAPKVTGTVNLDEASAHLGLKFFALFSSLSAVSGNVGQSDYAAANGFMDRYASYRESLRKLGHRHGRTLSINWPLWQDGGMQMQGAEAAAQASGLSALSREAGVQGFYQCMALPGTQLILAHGAPSKIRNGWLKILTASQVDSRVDSPVEAKSQLSQPLQSQLSSESGENFRDQVLQFLRRAIAVTLKIPFDRVEADAPFSQYGIDSLMVMQLTNELEKSFGSLSKTLFFEYQTLQELCTYFLGAHEAQLRDLLSVDAAPLAAKPASPDPKETAAPALAEGHASRARSRSRHRATTGRQTKQSTSAAHEEIAIIGLSGRYPQARTVWEFWENLKAGRDSITEIPADRWDYRLWFDEKKGAPGKSYSKWGGFVDGIAEFDPLFFNMSPREAEMLDPQERLFLQCVYETVEDAGYTRESLSRYNALGLEGNVGVFVGVMYEEYHLYAAQAQAIGNPLGMLDSAASIANRVSYLFNWHGPSMALDTMCSSSLTAIHLACQSLQRGNCEVAIAGGVNLSVHPNKYLALSQGRFVSSNGRCESFGVGGDGYVPGEGVGAVLLKPLSRAIEDGDQIYAVVKATATNHGGRTNGYSVPNPIAQSQVVSQCLKNLDVPARAISYIEAHGTGTSLGDPIEIAGLTRAFEAHTTDKQFCALGSAKANIGHCESAAGIAGITKVLLQMKHRQLVPSLHSSVLNPHIDFEKTPFVVQQEVMPWKGPVLKEDNADREYPLLAGVSSFGAGGSNAHVILQEHVEERSASSADGHDSNIPALVVLSASGESTLVEQARRLLGWIDTHGLTEQHLRSLAYTLQVGREAMEHRFALRVTTMQELKDRLQRFVNGESGIEETYRGDVKRNKEALSVFTADEELQRAIHTWVERGKFGKVLELWVKGLVLDWRALHGSKPPRRISLPTYPFARERYWIPQELLSASEPGVAGSGALLHPLAQRNTSDFEEQRFSSQFSGEEFYLRDHRVGGERVLPGVAYLEMARAALEHSGGAYIKSEGLRLRHVVWSRPFTVKDTAQLHIGLYPQDSGQIEYEVYSQESEEAERTVHSQGSAQWGEVGESHLEIDALKAACRQRLSGEQCYEQFRKIGLQYGPALQGIRELQIGEDGQGRRYVLAQLQLPPELQATQAQYVLHPTLLDSALQAAMGLSLGGETSQPMLPYAVDELRIAGRDPPRDGTSQGALYAYVREAQHSNAKLTRLDVELCDEQGRVFVQLHGFTARVLAASSLEAGGTLLLQTQWQEHQISGNGIWPSGDAHRVVYVAEGAPELDERYQQVCRQLGAERVIHVRADGELSQAYTHAAQELFGLLQAMLKDRASQRVLVQVVVPAGREVFCGLIGMLKTAQLENPKVLGQVLRVEATQDGDSLLKKLRENAEAPTALIRYEGERRYVESLQEVQAVEVTQTLFEPEGVYLITGGAGGLGRVFAQEIARSAPGAQIILAGRSANDALCEQLQQQGVSVHVRRTDVGDAASVRELIAGIEQQWGRLDGVLHAAGVVRDSFLLKKTPQELREVFAPKVTGTVNLDEASAHLGLKFFALFSSLSAVSGNVGQSDYAAANGFMDRYASYRESLRKLGHRHGRTLSINWPLWQDGGMQMQGAEAAAQASGLSALSREAGVQGFYQCMALPGTQLILAHGTPSKIRNGWLRWTNNVATTQPTKIEPVTAPATTHAASTHDTSLQDAALQYFRNLLATTLKLSSDRVEVDAPFERYGIESVTVMQLTDELEKVFGSLSKTLFFEYQTLQELCAYFVGAYADPLKKLLGLDGGTQARAKEVTLESPKPPQYAKSTRFGARGRGQRLSQAPGQQSREQLAEQDIAIIGLSGRYPHARNIREFWDNLKAGRDSITEIPADRWDYRLWFDENKGTPGKSYSKWGGFLDGVAEFDPLFFNISPRDAALIDPQERLFLQCVYETVEDAGYTRESLSRYNALGLEGNVGVFVGVMYEEYQMYAAQAQAAGNPIGLISNASSIANRVSFFFNWHGPSMALDTMCSSSLTAIHLACQSLQRGGCEVAVAGGVNLSVHPNKYLALSQGQFCSSKGRCESFGEGGDGYVPGEGVGAVLLKPLWRARRDGDQIYGVIKTTAINHGGRTNGYSVPNPIAQSQVVSQCLKNLDVPARAISYIEAHGTGTSLGDPIEIAGLTRAFEAHTTDKQFCALGSAKSNIGHCESAAGIAGITKVLLQMKHRQLVPSLHSSVLNPHIDFEKTPFVVQQEVVPWKGPVLKEDHTDREYPLLAGVSSFGAGGSNAHVILQDYVEDSSESPAAVSSGAPAAVILSAASEEALLEQAKRLLSWIDVNEFGNEHLGSLAYTLQVGREAMEHRLALRVTTMQQLKDRLQRYVTGETGINDLYRGEVKRNKEALSVLTADEDLQQTMRTWLEKGKHGKLLDLWSKGLSFDWTAMYEGATPPRRMSLPTYPFARDRYWIDLIVGNTTATSAAPALSARIERIFRKTWSPCAASRGDHEAAHVVILADAETQALAGELAIRFKKSEILLTHELPASSATSWQTCDAWIDLVGVGTSRDHDCSWMAQVQAWIEHGTAEGMVALCVTRGLESFHNDAPNLSGADRVGLYRMLQSEYARIRSRHIDLDSASSSADAIGTILAELSERQSENVAICYRGGTRYRAELREPPASRTNDFPRFADDEVVWVTGGTRGIGYLCAQHLVQQHGVRKLLLSGREALPPRQDWPLHENAKTALGAKIRNLRALEVTGAQIRVSSISLADREALQAELVACRETLGSVSAVLHCAGVSDQETPAFIRKSLDGVREILAPKVTGLDNLLACLEPQNLKFVVLFSSVSATVPSLGAGQSDYATANAYMDYVAEHAARRLPIVSIQWPSWKDVGIGEVRSPAYRESGLLSLENHEGLRLLDTLIERGERGVVLPAIVASDWQPRELLASKVRSARVATPAQKPSSGTRGASRVAEVRDWLIDLFARELRIDPAKLEADKPLHDYGADSVLLVGVLKQVGERVGRQLDPSALFEHPTIEAFSGWLVSTGDVPASVVDSVTVASVAPPVATATEERPPQAHDRPAIAAPLVHSDIAIVGLACRFPGAENLDEYWNLMAEGRSAIDAIPPERSTFARGKFAALLTRIDEFDPDYFAIPRSDARAMDPQARLVLEQSLSAFCHAGYGKADLKGAQIGVYLGARSMHKPDAAALREAANPMVAMGQNYLAANVCRSFDLHGPAVVVDTACSSALVAMSMAVQALKLGETDAALVGGVSVLHDEALRIFEQRGLLSDDPHFHIFDERARGAVLGEGAGMVVLKTVARARADGDRIYAVLKSVAVNNDGYTSSPTAPSFQSQKAVMQSGLVRSGYRPEDVTYIEVNGSGSEVTDLLELKAIDAIYRTEDRAECRLGSVKPNIGHPLCAEGIAGLIKVVLMLHRGELVPFTSGERPSRHYDLQASPFRFLRETTAWNDARRVAAINCFGDGGTNAHVVLAAWDTNADEATLRVPLPLPRLERIDMRPDVPSPAVSPTAHEPVEAQPALQPAAETTRTSFWRQGRGRVARVTPAGQVAS